jgi:hypothetical protein
MSPEVRAASMTVSKMRFGLSERRSRSRMSTSTVCTKPAHAGVALKDHDDGDDARRDGSAPGAREEISERFVGEKLVGARGEKRKARYDNRAREIVSIFPIVAPFFRRAEHDSRKRCGGGS